MTDEQVHVRTINKRIVAVSILLMLLSCGLLYYCFSTQSSIDSYNNAKGQESSLLSQVKSLEQTNNTLISTIEQTGRELVSFSEDKNKYISTASELSEECDVEINKFSVSDVWEEGTMSGMTVSVEVEGTLLNVQKFVSAYCDPKATNRINVVSCRPLGRFPWLDRGIDGNKVLTWFDLAAETAKQQDIDRQTMQEQAVLKGDIELGQRLDSTFIQETKENRKVISVAELFEPKTFKVYLVVDFLGRR